MLDSTLNFIFGPFLNLNPTIAIILISFILTLIVTLIYKYATNQSLMKVLKEDMKKMQNEMKQFREDPKKVMEIQKKAMETNIKYMMQSMKVTLITIIPFLLIFGWLSANFSYYPILANEKFTITANFNDGVEGTISIINLPEELVLFSDAEQQINNNKAIWDLKGNAGEYILEFSYKNKTYKKELLITEKYGYKNPITTYNDAGLKTIEFSNKKIIIINLLGWQIGWLGTYIIFSIIFTMILRKILKVH